MPSPFPGMDPYIEASGMWSDFHGSLLAAIRTDLNAHLPDGYAASIELFVWTGDDESGSTRTARNPTSLFARARRSRRALAKWLRPRLQRRSSFPDRHPGNGGTSKSSTFDQRRS